MVLRSHRIANNCLFLLFDYFLDEPSEDKPERRNTSKKVEICFSNMFDITHSLMSLVVNCGSNT